MKPIKLQINKRFPMGYSWVRYKPIDRILLTERSIFKTEAQLCYYIYKKFGVGRYQILAWMKGYEGFFLFWLGDILENGFIRDLRKNKELERLKGDFHQAPTFEHKKKVEEAMDLEREVGELQKGLKRSGPVSLKRSRPGQLQPYQEI